MVATFVARRRCWQAALAPSRRAATSCRSSKATAPGWRAPACRAARACTCAERLVDLPGATLQLRVDSAAGPPEPDPQPGHGAGARACRWRCSRWCCCWRATCGRRAARRSARWPRRWPSARRWRTRSITGLRARDLQGRITYVNPAFCEMVGLHAPTSCARRRRAALLAARAGRRVPAAPGRAPGRRHGGRAASREGFETLFMRKNGERFPVHDLRGAAGRRPGPAHRLDERGARHQRAAPRRGAVAPAAGAAAGHRAAGHRRRDGLAAEPRAEPAAGGDRQLRQRLAQPAGRRQPRRRRRRSMLRQAAQRIAEQAERAGRVIKSVHDFVRRREQAREAVGVDAADRRGAAAGAPAGAQERHAHRARPAAAARRACSATARWSSRCC